MRAPDDLGGGDFLSEGLDRSPFIGDGDYWPPCGMCGGDGELDAYQLDPLWYAPGDTVTCPQCGGKGRERG